MERAPGVQMEYEHVVLRTDRTADLQEAILDARMQDQLNEAGALGHAVLGALAHNPESRDGELSVILETGAGRRDQYEYRVMTTSRTSTLQNELSEAVAQDYAMVGRIERAGDHIACLERPKP